ncbi:alanine--tRNA ligase-related protein [Staphylococcus aureus]
MWHLKQSLTTFVRLHLQFLMVHYLPDQGRGYVLRRLLRRAVRFSQTLGINEPFMYKLVDIVGSIMEPYYPNVKERKQFH